MVVNRLKGEIIYNDKLNRFSDITGVVFLSCSWSDSILYLKYLVSIMEDFPEIDLYVIDIDKIAYRIFSKEFSFKSHGYGETFWLFKGGFQNSISNYNNEKEKVYDYTIKLRNMIQSPASPSE